MGMYQVLSHRRHWTVGWPVHFVVECSLRSAAQHGQSRALSMVRRASRVAAYRVAIPWMMAMMEAMMIAMARPRRMPLATVCSAIDAMTPAVPSAMMVLLVAMPRAIESKAAERRCSRG